MRLSSLLFLGATALATSTIGKKKKGAEKEDTYFNGVKIPPMLELTPDTFEPEIHRSKFMIIKHFSPYCPHCIDYAPNYQTLYEYYITSTPVGAVDTSFGDFYDFRFATINCIAFFDLCKSLNVQSYPSTVLYKDGEAVETVKGVKGLDILTAAIEPYLEAAKPGSRPKELNLPQPGDKQTPDYNAASQISSDTGADVEAPLPAVVSEEEAAEDLPKAAPEQPAKPLGNFNPEGRSVPLTSENFETLVASTNDPWFIKFYAPWCHHCQAMAPNWEQLGKEMKGKLNIGEVNCDLDAKLCSANGANAFPTILFLKGAERAEYEGLRGLGDFVQYADKAVGAAVGVVDVDATSLAALEEQEEVIFVYFYDHATTSEDFAALDRLPLSVIGRAKVVKTKDPELAKRYEITTFPRLLVSREGRPTYHNPMTPKEMRDVPAILKWVKSVWLPIVPELSATNAREIMDKKIVVLAIINREENEAFANAKKELKSAANEWMDKQILEFQEDRQELREAKQAKIDEAELSGDQRALRQAKTIRIDMDKAHRKEVAFAWVDGVFWLRWLRTTYGIDVQEGGRVIINDEDRHRYWDVTADGNNIPVSGTSILEVLSQVVTSPPQLRAKSTLGAFSKFFFDIRMSFVDHPVMSIGFVFAVMVAAGSWFRNRIRRNRGGHFARMDDSWSTKELMKEGLLGGGINGNGKVD